MKRIPAKNDVACTLTTSGHNGQTTNTFTCCLKNQIKCKKRSFRYLTSPPQTGVLVVLSGVSLRKTASMNPQTTQSAAQAIWRIPKTSTLFWLKMKYLCRSISRYWPVRHSPPATSPKLPTARDEVCFLFWVSLMLGVLSWWVSLSKTSGPFVTTKVDMPEIENVVVSGPQSRTFTLLFRCSVSTGLLSAFSVGVRARKFIY